VASREGGKIEATEMKILCGGGQKETAALLKA
jgi:hypothetical protein